MERTPHSVIEAAPESDDEDLARAASAGDQAAFEELYRRHSPTALKAARAVSGNDEDAADAVAEAFTRVLDALPRLSGPRVAFRPYLLTATRNAAHDLSRARLRLVSSGDSEDFDRPAGTGAPDPVVAGEDRTTLAEAFGGLPERWQAVLWLTEVEGCAPRDAAGLLGITANNVSQLAGRARARLRAGYLQAHVGKGVFAECGPAVDQLGAYIAGTLARGQTATLRTHLAGCDACTSKVEELTDLCGARSSAFPPGWPRWSPGSTRCAARSETMPAGETMPVAGEALARCRFA